MSAPAFLHSAYRAVEVRVRESLLLESAERAARSVSPERHAAMRRYYDAAKRRIDVACDLADEPSVVPSLILYREALQLLLGAVVISRSAQEDIASLRPPAVWDRFSELVRQGRVDEPPAALQRARELLAADDPLALDSRSSADLAVGRAAADESARWLTTLVDPRTPRQIRVRRSVHIGIVAAVAVGALAWGVWGLFQAPNLALHRPVTISKRLPQSTAPVDNSGLVNGKIESGYGIHTATGGGWVMVDLVKPTRVSKVRVYNRADGWFDDGLPFFLELSEDGTHFVEVDRRARGFTASAPWTYRAAGQTARYVRIRSDKYIAITEIEVYGSQ